MNQMIREHFRRAICILGMMACCFSARPQSANTGYAQPVFTDSGRLNKVRALFPVIDRIYSEYAAKNHFPGYAFGIMLDGKMVYSGAGGFADIEKKVPATTQTMFRIASMSKSFTAMAILKLRDEGKLKLDDPVEKYIPELKGQRLTGDAPAITIRNLLTHSAGFPEDNPWGDRQLADTDEELLSLLKNRISLSNVPSVAYEYSNLGFAMLGHIIKKVSGISYEAYIRKNIWQPLGMDQAEWEYTKVPAASLAHGYRWVNGAWKEESLLHDGSYGAMGGVITSIESFSKYVALHQDAWPPRNDRETGPVKRSSVREMHQPWRFIGLNLNYRYPGGRACPTTSAYGYGLSWTRDCEGHESIAHSGGLPGFGSNWRFLPEYGLGVILFANVTYAPTTPPNFAVLDTLIRLAQLKPRQLPPSPILTQRKNELLKLLPDFSNAQSSGIFAENFFADYYIDVLKKEAAAAFAKAGKIISVSEVIAENQLRGYFILRGENGSIRIRFTLTPENPALVQEYHLESESNESNHALSQNRIAGTYATDMMNIETAGIMAYSKSLTFKYNTDSVYYWQSLGVSGKGTYRISNNTLTIAFENTKRKPSPIPGSYKIITKGAPHADDISKKSVSFRFFDSENYPIAASIKIVSRNGKELLAAGTTEIQKFDIDVTDFPIRVKAAVIESFPIFFTVNSPVDFNAELRFQPSINITLCNGEIWRYDILQLVHDALVLRKIEDDYFNDDEGIPKRYTFVSYMKM